MAKYPIKMLKDEEGKLFVPLVSTDSVQDNNGESLEEKFNKKLEPSNIIAGENIEISKAGNNCTIKAKVPASANIINNLTTAAAGQGVLDAYQGKVLNDKIPGLVNSLESTDANKALSANQGKILNDKIPGLVNSLDSTDTSKALTANQGKVLNNKFNSYFPKAGGTISGSVGIGKEPNHTLDVNGTVKANAIILKTGMTYEGSKSSKSMISFMDNTVDIHGNGMVIGGGGATVIGGGESASTCKSLINNGGDERMIVANDHNIEFYTNCQNGTGSAKVFEMRNNGKFYVGGKEVATLSSAYPIGSFYISGNSTSPASLFGGTWQRLSGRFLYGYAGTSKNVGKDSMSTYTGGNTTGTAITIDQMPSHGHGTYKANVPYGTPYNDAGGVACGNGGGTFYRETYQPTVGVHNNGGGQPHWHNVPWLDVYIWQRTA